MQITFKNDYNAEALAMFCKRITYDDAYNKADGETETEKKMMAYRILSAISDLEECLAQAGYAPR